MIENDAIKKATRALQQGLEKELLGAWRAGYDWLHVYDPIPGPPSQPPEYTLRQYVLPSNTERPPRPSDPVYRHSYDLRNVTREDIDRAKGEADG